MDNKQLAKDILSDLGGAKNIRELENCTTRLRVKVRDDARVDLDTLNAHAAVFSVIHDHDELQVVLGPGRVSDVCQELRDLGAGDVQSEAAKGDEAVHTHPRIGVRAFLEYLSRVFAPLIPVFAGAGLLFGVKQVFVLGFELTNNPLLNPADVSDGGSVFMCALTVLAGTFFTYLNVAIAMSACKSLGGNPYLGLVAGGIISNVGGLAGADIGILGGVFTSGRGGALAAIAAGALCAVVEKRVRKHTPASLAIHLPSFVTILIVGMATLFVLQPLLGLVTDALTAGIMWVFKNLGALATMIISMVWLPMVMLGVHQGLTPIHAELIQTMGYTPLYAAGSMAGAGQVGAAIALLVKYRSHRGLTGAIRGGLPAAILGIGEPLIYGVSLPLGRVFALACVGASAGGFILGLFPESGAITISVSGILGTLVNTMPLVYLAGYAAAVAAGFVLVYFVGAREADLAAYEKTHTS